VRGAGRTRSVEGIWSAEDFGLQASPFSDLLGGDLTENLALTERLVEGTAPRGLEDTIVLNAAVCFWLTQRTKSVPEGIDEARDLLKGGAVQKKIADTRAFFRS
jgi:anthranilate phosphoribosyltransferase